MSTNWTLTGDFAGVAARQGGGGYVEPPTGAYKVKITGSEQHEKDGKTSVKFITVIDEGEHKGLEIRLFLGCDLSKMGNLRSWKTALLSAGHPANAVEANNVQFGPSAFDGKSAYIYFKARDANVEGSQANREFITPDNYKALSGAVTPAASNSLGAPVSAPANGTVAPKPQSSVRSLLG